MCKICTDVKGNKPAKEKERLGSKVPREESLGGERRAAILVPHLCYFVKELSARFASRRRRPSLKICVSSSL